MSSNTTFDKTEDFNATIKQIVDELIRQCAMKGIPAFVSCCIQNDEHESSYQNRSVFPDSIDVSLTNDLFPKYLNVVLGFDTVLRKTPDTDFFDDTENEARLIAAQKDE